MNLWLRQHMLASQKLSNRNEDRLQTCALVLAGYMANSLLLGHVNGMYIVHNID